MFHKGYTFPCSTMITDCARHKRRGISTPMGQVEEAHPGVESACVMGPAWPARRTAPSVTANDGQGLRQRPLVFLSWDGVRCDVWCGMMCEVSNGVPLALCLRCARTVRKLGCFSPPVATGPSALNSAPPMLF